MLNTSNNHALDALKETARQEIAQELEHFSHAETHFLAAWKRGVLLAGPQYFASRDHAGPTGRADVDQAVSKWDLCPRMDLIARAIGVMSPGEQRFLAALTSFYNSEDGGRLLRRAGFHGFADLGRLDFKRRTILAALVLSYTGW
jgi:hypothetical protein